MAIALSYRGKIGNEANRTVQWLKKQNKVTFIEWCPTGFKIGYNSTVAASVTDPKYGIKDILHEPKRSVTMIGNNVAITRVFTERITKKFDLMYSQRAFVHWCAQETLTLNKDNVSFLKFCFEI